MKQELQISEDSELYLVGFRIDSENDNGSDFYTLYLDSERPLDCDGYPIIFFSIQDMDKALALSNCGCNHLPLPQPENYEFIDIAFAIYEIGVCDKTSNANIVDCLNLLLDFVSLLHENRIHKKYKKIMRDAANHFTFSYDIESYFMENEVTRIEIVQAIEWSVGATALWAKYIRPE
jgi:hypothetical protein